MAIPSDSTIATVWPKLAHQRQYVARARLKMETCAKLHGSASVRIGVTGSGQKPCFRITYKDGDAEAIYGSFWDMGDPLEKEDAQNQNWSTAAMSFAEVDAFLKEKIDWPKA